LIDQHGIGNELGALELPERADPFVPVTLGASDGRVEHVVDERRLPRSAHAGHAGERVQRDGDVDVLQVVLGRAGEPDLLAGAAPATAPVRKGKRQLYRARFASFSASVAANTCLELRRRQIECFVRQPD
jgi:hypothetical protein